MTSVNNVTNASNTSGNNRAERPSQYIVKRRDTVSSIAKSFGMTVEQFKNWTGWTKTSLDVGDKIPLPTYTVGRGEGLNAIAKKYGMTLKELCTLNNITGDPNKYVVSANEKFYVNDKKKQVTTTETKNETTKPAEQKEKPAVETPIPAQVVDTSTVQVKPEAAEKPIYQPTNVAENKKKWNSSFTPQELAQKMYEAVDNNTGAVGKPVFDELLKEINPQNVEEVIKAYDALDTGETLINAITSEVKSDTQIRKNAVMRIYDALATKQGTSPKVRENFVKELDSQFESWGMVSTKKLDKTIRRMSATPEELAADIEQIVNDKWGAVGKPDFDELLLMIDERNVDQVITAYDNLGSGESLINAITSEVHSNQQLRKDAVMHIYDKLAEQKGIIPETRAEFKQILDQEFNSWGMVDTTKLDTITREIVCEHADRLRDTSNLVVYKHPKFGDMTGSKLQIDAINGALRDSAYKDKNLSADDIYRPLPNVNDKNQIEAASSLYLPDASHKDAPLKGKVVILNPGHGGYAPKNGAFDPGTITTQKDFWGKNIPIEEWQITDQYAKELTKKLTEEGATVVIVSGSVGSGGMWETQYLENLLAGNRGSNQIQNIFKGTQKSDMLFLSIHVESVKEKPDVLKCTVRPNKNDSDNDFANCVKKHIDSSALTPEIETDDLYVTRAMGSEIPAVLYELGNLFNDEAREEILSSKGRSKWVNSMADAIKETLLK